MRDDGRVLAIGAMLGVVGVAAAAQFVDKRRGGAPRKPSARGGAATTTYKDLLIDEVLRARSLAPEHRGTVRATLADLPIPDIEQILRTRAVDTPQTRERVIRQILGATAHMDQRLSPADTKRFLSLDLPALCRLLHMARLSHADATPSRLAWAH